MRTNSETETSSSEKTGSRGSTSDSDDQLSDDNAVRSSPNTKKTGASIRGKTVKKMFDQETSEEAAAELLQSYQVNTEQLGTKDTGQIYELTNAMAEIMMSRATKRFPIK